jgi:hypothetical protein
VKTDEAAKIVGGLTSVAAAMTLKRANVGGDESGVFMRQFAAKS